MFYILAYSIYLKSLSFVRPFREWKCLNYRAQDFVFIQLLFSVLFKKYDLQLSNDCALNH